MPADLRQTPLHRVVAKNVLHYLLSAVVERILQLEVVVSEPFKQRVCVDFFTDLFGMQSFKLINLLRQIKAALKELSVYLVIACIFVPLLLLLLLLFLEHARI